MTRYAAFLRGVNLGPTRKVDMAGLRAVAEEVGGTEVWTHLNSGNLGLRSEQDATGLERDLAAALRSAYGFAVDVSVRSAEELRALLDANPYAEDGPGTVTVAFLTGPPPAGAADRIAAVATGAEPFTVAGREVWVRYGEGQARSRLAARFSDVVGVSSTVRTVATVTAVLARLER